MINAPMTLNRLQISDVVGRETSIQANKQRIFHNFVILVSKSSEYDQRYVKNLNSKILDKKYTIAEKTVKG